MLGLECPPKWAIAAIAALVIGDGLLIAHLAAAPSEPSVNSRSTTGIAVQSGTTEPSQATPTTQASPVDVPAGPVIAVYGDGYSLGSSLGGQGTAGWPAQVAEQVNGDLTLQAVSMAGYAATGVTGEDFDDLASTYPAPTADVTIVFGSRNDLSSPPSAVEIGAMQTYRQIRETAPSTKLLVFGPAWSNANVPLELLAVRDAVERAARASGAIFVDPLAEGWFSDPGSLIAADGISPTDGGHAHLASRIAHALQPLVTDG